MDPHPPAPAASLLLGAASMALHALWWASGPLHRDVGAAGEIGTALLTIVVAPHRLAIVWGTTGRSYGSLLLGLRVRGVHGRRLGWPRAVLRAALCVVFPAGLLWVAISPRRRSVQDILLRSVVVYDWEGPNSVRPQPPKEVEREQ